MRARRVPLSETNAVGLLRAYAVHDPACVPEIFEALQTQRPLTLALYRAAQAALTEETAPLAREVYRCAFEDRALDAGLIH
ncbi:MAG TPA: hypothetical protein VFH51_08650, partial [Myxococcota bacterium]|nr:hypothetical protein [Myxococcota bacterium]